MQEAFREAAKNNPKSDVSRGVWDAQRNQREERQEKARNKQRTKEVTELTELMKRVGAGWRLYNQLGSSPTAKEYFSRLKESWEDNSLTRELQSASQIERVAMLNGFATGAMLDRPNLPPEYRRSFIEEILQRGDPLKLIQNTLGVKSWPSISPQAQLMVRAYGDLIGSTDEQRSALSEFMYETKDTKMVDLKASVVRISGWITSQSTSPDRVVR